MDLFPSPTLAVPRTSIAIGLGTPRLCDNFEEPVYFIYVILVTIKSKSEGSLTSMGSHEASFSRIRFDNSF